ncbi:MAG: response regulator [bacterium]|nr:response regulator [bacterium]
MDETQTRKDPKNSVFILDDVPKNVQLLVNFLRHEDCNIHVATEPVKGLEMIRRVLPDLILLDIMMPGMDGYQVCEALKKSEDTKDIPIIFLTAKTETPDIVKGFELGAVDYVTKPFQKAELLARVHTQLRLRSAITAVIELEKKSAVTAMAVTANHEINQPLTILQGNFEMYKSTRKEEDFSEKQLKVLGKMDKAIKRIGGILGKFNQSLPMHFEKYVGSQDMVVFDSPTEEGEN